MHPRSDPRRAERSAAAGSPAVPLWNRRVLVCLVGAAVFLNVAAMYAGPAALTVLGGFAVDGSIVLGWFLAAAMLGYPILRSLKVESRGALSFVTSAALGLGLFSLYGLLMGLVGQLNRGTTLLLLAVSVLIFGVDCVRGVVSPREWIDDAREWLAGRADWGWLWLAAMPFLAIAVLGASTIPGLIWKPNDPHPYDVTAYHLQVPREWFQAGRIEPLLHNVYSFFPFNTEMHYLMAMHLRGGPWAAMFQAQFISLGFMVFSIIAIYAITKQCMRSSAAGTIAGVAAVTVPWLTMLGSVAYIESGMILFSTLAIGWAMLASQQTVRRLALAGVMAGFACGTKYTAVPVVLLATPVALVLAGIFKGRMFLKPLMAGVALFLLLGTLVFSPWLIRNYAWCGNPVFPMAMRSLGHAHFDESQIQRWERAHAAKPEQANPAGRLSAAWNQILVDWQYGYVLIPAAGVLLFLFSRRMEVRFLGLLFLLHLLFWFFFTHLMSRFAVLLIPLAAMAIGLCVGGKRPVIGLAVVLLSLAMGLPPLMDCYAPFAAQGRAGMFRLTDLWAVMPEELKGIDAGPDTLALVGHGQAFLFPMPAGRLIYRSVFDVRFPPNQSPLDAWLGQDIAQLRRRSVVLIHPGELRRLSSTYFGVPPLPKEWDQVPDNAVVLPKIAGPK